MIYNVRSGAGPGPILGPAPPALQAHALHKQIVYRYSTFSDAAEKSHHHQEEIDGDELFHDMLTGLVCWGGAGIGKKDREASTGYASTGTPWDVRSWEARVWFFEEALGFIRWRTCTANRVVA